MLVRLLRLFGRKLTGSIKVCVLRVIAAQLGGVHKDHQVQFVTGGRGRSGLQDRPGNPLSRALLQAISL